jgi:hypothetical protein
LNIEYDENDAPIITQENYYEREVSNYYMSFHDYLGYAGHLAEGQGCEAREEAKRKGEWEEDMRTTAILVGSYVDAYFDDSLDKFKKDNPDIFTQEGELKAPYKRAEKMIARCEKDPLFMAYMSGEKQKIFTGYMFGTHVRCKLDSYIKGKAIVDLKTTSSLHKAWRIQDQGYVSVVEYWFYTGQLAWYRELVRQNTGEELPCYLAFVTNEDNPEICIVHVDDMELKNALNEIEMNMPNVLMVRNGEVDPIRCEKCDYCKATKKLTHAISYQDLIME